MSSNNGNGLLDFMFFLFYTLGVLVVLDVPQISYHVKVFSIIFWMLMVYYIIKENM